jgi:hypothetical protein
MRHTLRTPVIRAVAAGLTLEPIANSEARKAIRVV